jgi:hypothetical protein
VLAQQLGHGPVADLDALLEERVGQGERALARPAQRPLGITSGNRIDELLKGGPHVGPENLEWPLSARASDPDHILG